MSGPNQVRRFLGALSSLVLEGELPPDETPFLEGNGELEREIAETESDVREMVTTRPRPCGRCRGEGEVATRGVIVPCDEPGCVFRKG